MRAEIDGEARQVLAIQSNRLFTSGDKLFLILVMSRFPGKIPLPIRQIALNLSCSRRSVQRIVRKLHRNGWVDRYQNDLGSACYYEPTARLSTMIKRFNLNAFFKNLSERRTSLPLISSTVR